MPGGRPTGASRPGRGTPRTGAARDRRASAGSAASPDSATRVVHSKARVRPSGRGLGLTRRALVLVAVLAVLGLAYARSLTLYLSQQRDIQETIAANDARAAEIERLEDAVARWSDPDYVRAQARARLGWVLPGEIGYRIVTGDGTVLGAPVEDVVADGSTEDLGPWYAVVWSSVKSADLPG
ncbi:MAG: septum formation initiator family protein [Propionibacteriaceae bacterium]|nr:septum formation initiator family protein [Propionibacteriaceae bacterium]